ncbi:MAG: MmgE/PrpD family protein [Proteobacteria bacterium]|nr:MmgE/PrpD family protein [Pseudomonadota bacterium]
MTQLDSTTAASAPAPASAALQLGASAAQQLAAFAVGISWAALPQRVQQRARLHALDALGLALASHTQDFAAPALAGIAAAAGAGEASVIGIARRLAPRDAACANGLLMHGLDYDDTHQGSIVHPSVVGLPAALALGEALDRPWTEVLAAYAVGVEAAIRIGLAVDGGFHHAGFHATGVVSHFGAALAAGRLLGLDAAGLTAAQGIAASTAAGVQVFLEEGAWSKRLHPGWGALAGITAAHLAQAGFKAPTRPYEGRFGLFESHLHGETASLAALTDGLGERWHLPDTAIKPYPVCHFIHGCLDAALELHQAHGGRFDPAEVEQVTAWLAPDTLPIVAEPADVKRRAATDYEAKFSAHHCVAAMLLRGGFGLPELTPAALADPATRALALRVDCRADPETRFPEYFSGGVTLLLRDGRRLHRHVAVNKGAGARALDAADIEAKFLANATLHLDAAAAQRVLDAVLGPQPPSTRALMALLRRDG